MFATFDVWIIYVIMSILTLLVLSSKNCSTTVIEHGAHEIAEKTIMGSQNIFSRA